MRVDFWLFVKVGENIFFVCTLQTTTMGFWQDFGRGFKQGFGGTLQVAGHLVPGIGGGISAAGKEIRNLHKGGRVPKTGNYRLRQGEVVMNKTQMARLRKAKTAKTKRKIVSQVVKRKPQKPKKRAHRKKK